MNDKPSTLLAAVGLGALSACAVSLLLYAIGYMPSGWAGLGAFCGFFGAGFGLVPWWEWAHYTALALTVAETPAAVARPVTQYERVFNSAHGSAIERRYKPTTTTEAAWIDALAEFCLWVRDLQSLAGPKHLAAGVVANPNDWQDIVQPLVDHGAVLPKRQGVETKWAAQWDATRAYNAVLAGYVTFPDRQPPKVRPFPARTATIDATVPVEAEG